MTSKCDITIAQCEGNCARFGAAFLGHSARSDSISLRSLLHIHSLPHFATPPPVSSDSKTFQIQCFVMCAKVRITTLFKSLHHRVQNQLAHTTCRTPSPITSSSELTEFKRLVRAMCWSFVAVPNKYFFSSESSLKVVVAASQPAVVVRITSSPHHRVPSTMHAPPGGPAPLQCMRTWLVERGMLWQVLRPYEEHAPCLCKHCVHGRKKGVHIRRLSSFLHDNFTPQFFAHLSNDPRTLAACHCIPAYRAMYRLSGM